MNNHKRVAWGRYDQYSDVYFVKLGDMYKLYELPEVYLFAKKYNANIFIVNTGELITW